MPVYEYECTRCGHIEEAFQNFSDKPLTRCGHCTGKLRKLISHSSFHLKGTGWYVTDYANRSKNSQGASGKKAKSDSESAKSANPDTSTSGKSED
jgi:putative FmdB family regulatory protein